MLEANLSVPIKNSNDADPEVPSDPTRRVWTDDYNNLFGVLK